MQRQRDYSEWNFSNASLAEDIAAIGVKRMECIELSGGVHDCLHRVLRDTNLIGIMIGIDEAARLVRLRDALALMRHYW